MAIFLSLNALLPTSSSVSPEATGLTNTWTGVSHNYRRPPSLYLDEFRLAGPGHGPQTGAVGGHLPPAEDGQAQAGRKVGELGTGEILQLLGTGRTL